MFSNIVKLGLVAMLFLGLVGGAVYILVRPSEARAGYAAQDGAGWGAGRRMVSDAATCDDCGAGVGRGAGRVGGSGQGSQAVAESGRGGALQGLGQRGQIESGGLQGLGQRGQIEGGGLRGQGSQANSLWSETTPPAWETIEGTVVESGSELLVDTGDGEVLVGLGQAFYREEQGFTVAVGDTVRVDGFHEDGEFKAGTVENLSTGARITLRDATGRPMWSGRGNNQNRS